ncbi:hypothetical protein JCM11641_004156 [Rhodosporidiobolus odoratus]
MPPKKKSAPAPTRSLPPPSATHPCAALLPSIVAPSCLPERPHPASYHTFLSSPFYPGATSVPAAPPPKKRKKTDEPALPPLLDCAIEAAVVQKKLLEWFETVKGARGMPWRKDVDPAELSREERAQRGYEVWVSEIMLQQTQVVTCISYWKKWMQEFPTVKDLAEADVEDVNAVWTGLGYYSRAKRLLEGAKIVMDKYDGLLPETVEELLQIDGIGPYTAGAVSSIAFAKRSPLVDGNVQRVFSRFTAFHAPPAAKPTINFIWALADVLVPAQPSSSSTTSARPPLSEEPDVTSSPHFKGKKKRSSTAASEEALLGVGGPNKPGAWNQALMELGATVCTPKNPRCDECPVREACLAYAEARYSAHSSLNASTNEADEVDIEDLCTLCAPLPYDDDLQAKKHNVEVYPMAKERAKKREEETAVCVLEWMPQGAEEGDEGRKVLLMKRPEKGLLAGLYEFPAVDSPPSSGASTAKTRNKYLDALLPTLIDIPDLADSLSSSSSTFTSSSFSTSSVSILSRTQLPTVTHVYSHMVRTYHPIRVVLTSTTPPALHSALASSSSSSTDSAKAKVQKKKQTRAEAEDEDAKGSVVQSLPGRGKWVDAHGVEGANIGGAVGKVWEERQRAVKGLSGPVKVKGKGKGKGAGKKLGGEKEGKGKVERGQGSLLGFFAKREGEKVDEVVKVKKRQEKVEGSDDDLVIMEEKQVDVEATKEETRVEAKEQKKVYKKRRIAPSSDTEDEG